MAFITLIPHIKEHHGHSRLPVSIWPVTHSLSTGLILYTCPLRRSWNPVAEAVNSSYLSQLHALHLALFSVVFSVLFRINVEVDLDLEVEGNVMFTMTGT